MQADNGAWPVEVVPGRNYVVDEARRFLRVSRSKVYQMMEDGQLEYLKFGACRRIPGDALLRLVERCTVRAG
jgi:excisionase family DNA binding protein